MSTYTTILVDEFAQRGAILDTNLLLLYVVGHFDEEILKRQSFDRLSMYELSDFRLLQGLLSLFSRKLTTSHVLAEVSNWIGHLGKTRDEACHRQFNVILKDFEELSADTFLTASHSRFPFLGVTDTALLEIASSFLVVTDDGRFSAHLEQMGLHYLNINYLRTELWLLS